MAELHVQRKRGNLLWLWIVLVILLIAGGFYYYKHINDPKNYPIPGKATSSVLNNIQNNKI